MAKKTNYLQNETSGKLEGSTPYPFSKPRDLTAEETEAIQRYVGEEYQDINEGLRANQEDEIRELFDLETLDSAVGSQTALNDMFVYRGISPEFAEQLKKGTSFVDKGYLSTSLTIAGMQQAVGELDDQTVLMEIRIPKGTKLLDIGRARMSEDKRIPNTTKAEAEILFSRNGKLLIGGTVIRNDMGGRKILKATLLERPTTI